VTAARTISGGGLVTGGGDLSGNRTLTVTAATNEQGEAGEATNVAMTPASTAAAIAALAPEPDLSGYATETYVDAAVEAVVGEAPIGLNTLVEIANSLNNDTNFHGSVASALTLKANAANAALTGTPTAPTAAPGTNSTQIASTAYADAAAAAAAAAINKTAVGLGNVTNHAQLKVSDLDTDATMAANSDAKVPSQKAVKSALALKLTTTELLQAIQDILASDGRLVLPNGKFLIFNDAE